MVGFTATNFAEPERADRDCQRRKAEAAARVRRINSRTQGKSTDLLAIDEQVKEKRDRLRREREEQLADDRQRVEFARTVHKLERQESHDRRLVNMQYAQRNKHTPFESRTTFDLDNNDLHARGGFVERDANGFASVSSLQSFDGEDHRYDDRKALQQRQMRTWSQGQVAERDAKLMREREEDCETAATVNAYNRVADQQMLDEEARKQAVRGQVESYNQALAKARAQKAAHKNAVDKELEAAEVAYQTTSDFLTESKGTTYRWDSNRRKPEHMKGFSGNEIGQIRNIQDQQRRMLEEKRERELAEERTYARQQGDITRLINLHEREKQRARRRDLMQTKQANHMQKLEKQHRDRESEAYQKSLTASEKFFSNFECSDR